MFKRLTKGTDSIRNIIKAIKINSEIIEMHKTQLIILNQTIKDMNERYKDKHGEYLLKNKDFQYK